MVALKMGVLRGDRLKEYISKRGFSQETFAEALSRHSGSNTTQQGVSGWIRGKNDPSLEMILAIAEVLDVSVDFLLGVVQKPDEHYLPSLELTPIKERLLWYISQGKVTEAFETLTLIVKGSDETGVSSK